jgi:hypothetical protein
MASLFSSLRRFSIGWGSQKSAQPKLFGEQLDFLVASSSDPTLGCYRTVSLIPAGSFSIYGLRAPTTEPTTESAEPLQVCIDCSCYVWLALLWFVIRSLALLTTLALL